MDPACQASAIFKYSYNCTETSNNGQVAASFDRKLKPTIQSRAASPWTTDCVYLIPTFLNIAVEGADKTC